MNLLLEIAADDGELEHSGDLSLLKGRKFQLWEYRVGHGSLLVRSPKDSEHPTNVDVICMGVEYLELPRFMADLSIEQANPDEVSRARTVLMDRFRKTERTRIFAAAGNRFLVVSISLSVSENKDGFWESPFDSPKAKPSVD